MSYPSSRKKDKSAHDSNKVYVMVMMSINDVYILLTYKISKFGLYNLTS